MRQSPSLRMLSGARFPVRKIERLHRLRGRLNEGELTAAHKTLPCGTKVKVHSKSNGRSVTVTINDRGPFVKGRVVDVSPAAARGGVAKVSVSRE